MIYKTIWRARLALIVSTFQGQSEKSSAAQAVFPTLDEGKNLFVSKPDHPAGQFVQRKINKERSNFDRKIFSWHLLYFTQK